MVSQETIYKTVFELCNEENDSLKIDALLKLLHEENKQFNLKNINVDSSSSFHFVPNESLFCKYFLNKEMSKEFYEAFSSYTKSNLMERKGIIGNFDKTKFEINHHIRASYITRQKMDELKLKLQRGSNETTQLRTELKNKTTEIQELKTTNNNLLSNLKKRERENNTLEERIKKVKTEEDLDYVTIQQELRDEHTKYINVQTELSKARLEHIKEMETYKKENADLKREVNDVRRITFTSPTSYTPSFFSFPPPPPPPISNILFSLPGNIFNGILWLLNHSNTKYELHQKRLKLYLNDNNHDTIGSVCKLLQENNIQFNKDTTGVVTTNEYDEIQMEDILLKIFCYVPHEIQQIYPLADSDLVAILYWLTENSDFTIRIVCNQIHIIPPNPSSFDRMVSKFLDTSYTKKKKFFIFQYNNIEILTLIMKGVFY